MFSGVSFIYGKSDFVNRKRSESGFIINPDIFIRRYIVKVRLGRYWAADSVNVPSGRGIGDIGIVIPIGLRSHKGAGNAFYHALSSSAWRFLTRILAPT